MAYNYTFKYIIIGEMGVGKTCLMQRLVDNHPQDYRYTIGVEFGSASFVINGEQVKLQIWDTAGQERFRSVTRGYYRGSAGVLIVYDVSRRATFARVANWLTEAKAHTGAHTTLILIGNKCDLDEDREVSKEEGAKFAEENNLMFLECSAKSGENVDQAFVVTATKIHEKILCGILDPQNTDSGVYECVSNGKPVVHLGKANPSSNSNNQKNNNCAC